MNALHCAKIWSDSVSPLTPFSLLPFVPPPPSISPHEPSTHVTQSALPQHGRPREKCTMCPWSWVKSHLRILESELEFNGKKNQNALAALLSAKRIQPTSQRPFCSISNLNIVNGLKLLNPRGTLFQLSESVLSQGGMPN